LLQASLLNLAVAQKVWVIVWPFSPLHPVESSTVWISDPFGPARPGNKRHFRVKVIGKLRFSQSVANRRCV
jgi:hypothetical protein